MDSEDAAVFMAMPLQTNEEVIAWFEILRTAHAGLTNADSVEEFGAAVRGAATWCDPQSTEAFLAALVDLGPIARMVADPPKLPDTYWELYHQWYGAEGVAPAEEAEEPFGWLTAEQAARLQGAWGDGWRDHLGPQLDYRWGEGWQQHPAEHRQHWLDGVLDELLAPAPAEPPAAGSAQPDKADPDQDGAEDLDALAAEMVAETLAELEDDIEPMSEEEIAEAVAIVRRRLQEEQTR